jgi:hypothetical protein
MQYSPALDDVDLGRWAIAANRAHFRIEQLTMPADTPPRWAVDNFYEDIYSSYAALSPDGPIHGSVSIVSLGKPPIPMLTNYFAKPLSSPLGFAYEDHYFVGLSRMIPIEASCGTTSILVGEQTVDDKACFHIRSVIRETGVELGTWFIDKKTLLPVSVVYNVLGKGNEPRQRWQFGDYVWLDVGGARFPVHAAAQVFERNAAATVLTMDVIRETLTVNTPIDKARFNFKFPKGTVVFDASRNAQTAGSVSVVKGEPFVFPGPRGFVNKVRSASRPTNGLQAPGTTTRPR